MAHGTPDWGLTAGTVTTYQLSDLAELAARLGSIVTYDRRGEVLLLENFEDGLIRWASGLSGADAAVDLSSIHSRFGAFATRLVAGSDDECYAGISTLMAFPAVSALGLECSFSLEGEIEALLCEIEAGNGVEERRYRLQWDALNSRLQYQDVGWGLVTFASGVNLYADPLLFHTLKLVVRPDLGQYARLILNAGAFDLSGKGAPSFGPSTDVYLRAHIRLVGRAGYNDIVYVDDVILTHNEPV
jgi:hypothetical protein